MHCLEQARGTILYHTQQLEKHSVERRYLRQKMFRRLTASVNQTIVKPRVVAVVGHKTILKPRLAAATNTYTSDFPDVKFCVAWLYDSGVSNPVPDYNLDQA